MECRLSYCLLRADIRKTVKNEAKVILSCKANCPVLALCFSFLHNFLYFAKLAVALKRVCLIDKLTFTLKFWTENEISGNLVIVHR